VLVSGTTPIAAVISPSSFSIISNNEIIIHPIKDSWTREEVENMKRAIEMLLECPSLSQEDLEGYDVEAIEFATKVLKENL